MYIILYKQINFMFATFRFFTSHRSSMNIIIPDPFARAWNYYKEEGLHIITGVAVASDLNTCLLFCLTPTG